MNRKAVLPVCVMESVQKSVFSRYNRENARTWEIIKAVPVKSGTGEIHAYFQPLSLHFFERMDS